MKKTDGVDREEALQIKMREDLALRFRNFPHFVTLALWICLLPIIMITVGWIWGFWEAMIASLIILAAMMGICVAFCLTIKPGSGKPRTSQPQRAAENNGG